MKDVTIHAYDRQWKDAQVVGVGTDTFTSDDDVLMVRHPAFNADMDFYAEVDEQGRHPNVGNAAFWITTSVQEKGGCS